MEQFLERFGVRFCLARVTTGMEDCHGWVVEIDVPLKEIGERNG